MACLKAERVDVRVVVVTNAGLEQALGEIVKLDERALRQYAQLFAEAAGAERPGVRADAGRVQAPIARRGGWSNN